MRCVVLLTLVFLSVRAWADDSPREIKNSLGMKLIRIEAGQFVMGNSAERPATQEEWKRRDWDESPAHKVTISSPFLLAATEVTNTQFEQFNPNHRELRGIGNASKGDDEPVTLVTWQQAVEFCQWLSRNEGRTYRLPTEAEWEYACRAGSTTVFHTGDALTVEQANIAGDRRNRTRPVGSYKPNAWGLYDMHGNVEEWCLDWYGPYVSKDQTDPVGRADGYVRVTRGGSYDIPSWQKNSARYARSANRSGRLPEDANRCTGFRVVLSAMPNSRPLPAVSSIARNANEGSAERSLLARRADVPDPNKPYFDDFKGRRPTLPANTWGPIFSKHNHFAACCVCPNGDVLACWYTTNSESGRELAQAASRLPAGSDQWQPALLFFNVPDVNDHAPVLLTHKGRMYHFASQSLRGWDETTNVMRTSDDNGATWTKPRIIFRREGPNNLSQACSAFATDDGTIYLAVDGSGHRTESLLVSRDEGKTWAVAGGDLRKAVGGKYAIHPTIASGKDGSVVAFLRGLDPMPRLISDDRGETWRAIETKLSGIGVGQKAAALRLKSGALLMCASDTRKPPITGMRGTLAALSYDDGKTWSHIRHVPDVGGYMSADQAPSGIIYVFGSRMSCAAFNEAWVKATIRQ